jgi:hypothetical protein
MEQVRAVNDSAVTRIFERFAPFTGGTVETMQTAFIMGLEMGQAWAEGQRLEGMMGADSAAN